jgi:hypothetical protein
VNRKSTPPIPEAIMQLQRRLDQFRNTQTQRTRLPEALWEAAVELARQHGIYRVAHSLRLDYMGLKRRLGGVSTLRRKASKPTFVELTAPAAPVTEYAIDFESPGGRKMRIQWKASASPDWISLLRAWREMEG